MAASVPSASSKALGFFDFDIAASSLSLGYVAFFTDRNTVYLTAVRRVDFCEPEPASIFVCTVTGTSPWAAAARGSIESSANKRLQTEYLIACGFIVVIRKMLEVLKTFYIP